MINEPEIKAARKESYAKIKIVFEIPRCFVVKPGWDGEASMRTGCLSCKA